MRASYYTEDAVLRVESPSSAIGPLCAAQPYRKMNHVWCWPSFSDRKPIWRKLPIGFWLSQCVSSALEDRSPTNWTPKRLVSESKGFKRKPLCL
jgi:hypothetical protein